MSVYLPQVIHCPYCQTLIQIDAPECPACRLSYPRTSALVGALPRLNPMVADTTGHLRGADVNRLKKQILKIQRRFPQLVLQVVMHRFSSEHPFSMHAFWLFNAAAIAGEGKRGRKNHALMVVIDPFRMDSAIVPGYGLEPLLRPDALNHLLELSGPAFESKNWEMGLNLLLDGLEGLLESVSIVNEGVKYGENEF
ncbi:hypothetical protein ACFSSA_04880 [Luteolibacter algae]|uniref:TPM domain-containing protein n=1 Tax=Luteolibacter algae TaxID=454151 RepID=A0ABW5D571_9BACT